MTAAFRRAIEYVSLQPLMARIQQDRIGWLQSEIVLVNPQR